MTTNAQSGAGLRAVAIALSAAALGLVTLATIVVLSRGGKSADAREPEAPAKEEHADSKHVAATDVVRLKRDTVTPVLERGSPVGMRVSDAELRDKLGLGNDDVIVSLSGRAVLREWDVLDAISGLVMLDAKTVYVELQRAGKPALVRWQVDGDLKTARRASVDLPSRLPSVQPVADPIVTTIEKVDDTHYTMPRDTADKLTADPATYTKGVRGFASFAAPEGVRLYLVRKGTFLSAIGLADGDTVTSINGSKVTTMDQLNERLSAIKSAATWTIEVERRHTPVTLQISVKS